MSESDLQELKTFETKYDEKARHVLVNNICFNHDGTKMAYSSNIYGEVDFIDLVTILHLGKPNDISSVSKNTYQIDYPGYEEVFVRKMCFATTFGEDVVIFFRTDGLDPYIWDGVDKITKKKYEVFHELNDVDDIKHEDIRTMKFNNKHRLLVTSSSFVNNSTIDIRKLADRDMFLLENPIYDIGVPNGAWDFCFSPDEDVLLTFNKGNTSYFYDLRQIGHNDNITIELLFTISMGGIPKYIPGDNNRVISMDENSIIKVWDLKTKSEVKTFPELTKYSRDFTISANGNTVAIMGPPENRSTFLNLATGKVTKGNIPPIGKTIEEQIVFHPKFDSILITTTEDEEKEDPEKMLESVTVWEVINEELLVEKPLNSPIGSASARRSPRNVKSVELPSAIYDPFMEYDEMNHETQKVQSADGNPGYEIHPLDTDKFKFKINDEDFPIMFVHGNSMNVLTKSNLERILQDTTTLVYECSDHVPEDAICIRYDDLYSVVPYVQTASMGLSSGLTGLIKLSDIQDILNDTPKIRIKRNQQKRIEELDELFRSEKPLDKDKQIERIKTILNDANVSPRIYMIKEVKSKGKPKVVERIVSERVLQGGSAVSGHHCQKGQEYPLYTLEEVKKAKKKSQTRKSKSPNKRNSRKVRSV